MDELLVASVITLAVAALLAGLGWVVHNHKHDDNDWGDRGW